MNWPIVEFESVVLEKGGLKRGPFGGAIKKEIFVESGYKVYEQKNAILNNFELGHYYIDQLKFNELQDFEIRPNDLIVSCSGTIGKVAIVPEHVKPGIINQALLRIRPNKKVISPEYLKRVLETPTFQRELFDSASGSAIKNLKPLTEVRNTKLSLPPLAEQQRIAAILNKADALREKRRQAMAKLAALLQSVFLEMFGDPVTNPKGWKTKPLSSLVEEFRYGTSNKSEGTGKPALRIPNVVGQKINLDDLKYVPVSLDEFERLRLIDGDLLFVRTNGNPDYVGRCAVFDSTSIEKLGYQASEFIYASYLIRARLFKNQVEPIYLQHFLNTTQGQRELRYRCRTSAGQYNINTESLGAVSVPVPQFSLQQEFIKQVIRIRSLESRLIEGAKRIESLFDSLQQRAFKGELFTEKAAAAIQQELFAE